MFYRTAGKDRHFYILRETNLKICVEEHPKRCSDCGSTEVGTHYKTTRCKECQTIETKRQTREKIARIRKERGDEYRAYQAEKQREWAKRNREKVKENHQTYYQENREACLERTKKWQAENPEKLAEIKQKYHEENRDEILERYKKYYLEHYDYYAEYRAWYYEENKEKWIQYRENRRMKRNNKK